MNLKIEAGALVDVPIWEDDGNGRNWCATIVKDPNSPGGLGRKFWGKAKGQYFYIVPPDLAHGTPLEFGADYFEKGKRKGRRQYFFVQSVSDTDLTLCECQNGAKAIEEGEAFARNIPDGYSVFMRRPKVVVVMKDGLVSNVYCNVPSLIDVVVVETDPVRKSKGDDHAFPLPARAGHGRAFLIEPNPNLDAVEPAVAVGIDHAYKSLNQEEVA